MAKRCKSYDPENFTCSDDYEARHYCGSYAEIANQSKVKVIIFDEAYKTPKLKKLESQTLESGETLEAKVSFDTQKDMFKLESLKVKRKKEQ